ncbi:rho GTPase-activating protein 15 [Pseudochaenichthys georgianus]|uniref:rho GTPase-activating protein 15 n=1 Tax=Pseudochaenichthys georgianus TaxID=52239 RepID=UPI00146AA404|nr:rho GTPase-activating protein 15 [Pseudochaenichthys georgianus]
MFVSSKLKHSASDSADKNGVKNRLKKFIIRRPSMKTLQEKGLIKDQVFGCHLLTLCEREGSTVPSFVQLCLDAIEKRGMDVDGIYRVSGNLSTVQKLRFMVDQEEALDLDQSQWEDVHVVTGALKMFFRELPEPLFPFRAFQPFVEAIKIKDSRQKVQAVKKLIQDLPRPNQDTMTLLFSHLHRVLTFSRQNLMSTQGIGIVFGPTLMWPELDGGNMAVNMVYQNQIIEFILIESCDIFSLDRK